MDNEAAYGNTRKQVRVIHFTRDYILVDSPVKNWAITTTIGQFCANW